MNFVIAFFIKYRKHLVPLIAVLALTIPLSLGVYQLGKQSERLGHLAEANKQWSIAWSKMNEVREIERKNAEDLAVKIDSISKGAHNDSQRLKELEQSNEEVRNILNTRLPDDLKRLLNER